MKCPHCGSVAMPGNRNCIRCGKPVGPAEGVRLTPNGWGAPEMPAPRASSAAPAEPRSSLDLSGLLTRLGVGRLTSLPTPLTAAATALVIALLLAITATAVLQRRRQAQIEANEKAALAKLQAVMDAELSHSLRYEHFDTIECLIESSACLPGVPEGTASLDPKWREADPWFGYEFAFYPGPPPSDRATRGASPTGTTAYAYVATPVHPGRTGIRSFCADSAGTLCSVELDSVPLAAAAACPPGCTPLPRAKLR